MQSFTNKLRQKQKQNNAFFFLILGWLEFIYLFIYFEVRTFIVAVLKTLVFSTSKRYFIYFTTSLNNTPNIKCSIFFFITSFKII